MHRALPVVFALLAVALYVLLGRGGDEAPDSPEPTGEAASLATAAGGDGVADPDPATAPDPVAERPLLDPRAALAPTPRALGEPVGPDSAAASAGAERPADGGRAEVGSPRDGATEHLAAARPEGRLGQSAPAQTQSGRGGALRDPGCRLSLNRLLLARGIAEREPTAVSTVFSSDDVPVYAFMDVNNFRGPEQDVVVHWDHLDSDHTYVQRIPVGPYPRWRTWLYHTMRRPLAGRWHVRVTDQAGCTIGEMDFEATPYLGPEAVASGR